MAIIKRIVCLANSYKHSGRCIAGKEYKDPKVGSWVRPVSAREGQEVNDHERQYENGTDPQLLDIIDVPLISDSPQTYQSENWLLDPNLYWVKRGCIDWANIAQFVDAPETLWVNGSETYHGGHDYVPAEAADNLDCSLYLIHVERLVVSVFLPGEIFGNMRRRVQGNFVYRNVEYGFSITDPVAKHHYLEQGLGEYTIQECYLSISLGERHTDNRCYKLIAAIMERPRS